MAKTTEKVNLFASAQKVPTKTTAAKTDKEIINLSAIVDGKGQKKYPNAPQLLLDYQKYHTQKAEAEAMLKTKGAELKEIGKTLWCEKYQEVSHKPESFIMIGDDSPAAGKLMFISSDSYLKIDEITATILDQKYGCVEKKETFIFNNDMLAKYGQVLSDLIVNSKLIADEDKAMIVRKEEEKFIKKGTIDNVALIESITGKPEKGEFKFADPAEMIENVNPTFSLKNC